MVGTADGEVEVRVIYPSARKPAERDFALAATVREVKLFALREFGLTEGPDPENTANQVVFFLYHDRTKIENLDQPLSTFSKGNEEEITFRLVREVIVG
jgi:hypothetical protein